ncbi:MAG TPA: DUF5319 family protein [Pseudonocardiaceae bacterium]
MVSADGPALRSGEGVPCSVVRHDALPPDPFAGDPLDPARELEAMDDPAEQLDESERADVLADLTDLALYQLLLEPRGIRGIVVDCADCEQPHFHEWELLQSSLRQLLRDGRVRPHEPACEPDTSLYVSWDYCRGFADATLACEAPAD